MRVSTLFPHEEEAIFSVRRSLNTVDKLLPSLVGQPGWDAFPARLLVLSIQLDRVDSAVRSEAIRVCLRTPGDRST